MKNTQILIFVLHLGLLLSCSPSNVTNNTEATFITNLMDQMTVEEKNGQLVQYSSKEALTGPEVSNKAVSIVNEVKQGKVGSFINVDGAQKTYDLQKIAVDSSRLGIPLIFGYDVLHGYKTIMPVALASASSWNENLIKECAKVTARETAASGLHWTFAPMLDVSRDARWGRIVESCGEDPYLTSVIAKATVEGLQGTALSDTFTVAACAKHFAGYAFAESGIDYNTTEITEQTLRDVVLPPFKACVDAGVATFMSAFNDIGGIPCSKNKELLTGVLRDEWGFDGFVVSDWNSIGELITHGVVNNRREATIAALDAGVDMDMEGRCYKKHLKDLIAEGVISEEALNKSVERILKIKYRLGLFEDPYRYSSIQREKDEIYKEENLEVSEQMARESIVLLKNDESILPLKAEDKKIAVIGPLANDKDVPLGSWRARAEYNSAVSLWEGLQKRIGDTKKLQFAKGCSLVDEEVNYQSILNIEEEDRSGFAEAVRIAKNADVVILAIGEHCYQTGEARSQTDITLKGLQIELFEEIYKVNKNIAVVLMNGRPLDITAINDKAKAIVETWFLGSRSGYAIADVLTGAYNPSGRLPVSFPRNVGQQPLYYAKKITGRPAKKGSKSIYQANYKDNESSPLYPFGYGLSYSNFSYSTISADKESFSKGGSIQLSIKVTNDGKYDGTETVQLYVYDPVASVARPIKELKLFKQIHLKVGESKKVEFTITEDELSFWHKQGGIYAEEGEFVVMIGANSQDCSSISIHYNI
ncbi:beta-glucosidase BglX [Labilibacter sediminis]|nr:beta-glucosidase BglX [Labilibacter sediminis]